MAKCNLNGIGGERVNTWPERFMHQTQDEDYSEVLSTQSATTDKHSKVGQRS